MGVEGKYVNIIKARYDKPLANICSAEQLKTESFSSNVKEPLLFNIVPEVLATAVRQRKEISIQIANEEVKLSLFADDMALYMKNPKTLPKDLETTDKYSKVAGYKINVQKSIAFLYKVCPEKV